jgi:hypothetical protein
VLATAIVDWDKILDLVWTAALAGIGVSVVYAIAVYGATRASDMRRAGRATAAAVYGVVGLAGFAASCAVIAYGVVLITSK